MRSAPDFHLGIPGTPWDLGRRARWQVAGGLEASLRSSLSHPHDMRKQKANRKAKNKVRAHCPRCRHIQPFIRASINHPLHLAVTVVTGGLWSVSWLALCIGKLRHPWRCEHCGCHSPDFRVPAPRPEQQSAAEAPTPEKTAETSKA